MNYLRRVVGTILPLIFLCVAFAPVASAQQAAGITIKPGVIEDNATPGELYQFALTATNDSTVSQTYYLLTQDITGLDNSGQPTFAQPGQAPTGYELSSWVKLPESSVTLAAGESKTINVSIQVPQNATPGSHFAGVFFSLQPPKTQTTGAGVGYNVGAVVSLTIAGDIVEGAQLTEFSTDKYIYSSPDVTFGANVTNSGNVLVRPNGVIQIHNMLGAQVATLDVNSTGGAVFPSSNRTFSVEWKGQGLAFGRYEAVASLAYGDQARHTLTTTTSFWVLPLNLIGGVLGALLLIILVFYVFMRMYVRRKLRAMGADMSGDSSYYSRKYQRSGSRLMVVLLSVIIVCIVLLVALFLLFA